MDNDDYNDDTHNVLGILREIRDEMQGILNPPSTKPAPRRPTEDLAWQMWKDFWASKTDRSRQSSAQSEKTSKLEAVQSSSSRLNDESGLDKCTVVNEVSDRSSSSSSPEGSGRVGSAPGSMFAEVGREGTTEDLTQTVVTVGGLAKSGKLNLVAETPAEGNDKARKTRRTVRRRCVARLDPESLESFEREDGGAMYVADLEFPQTVLPYAVREYGEAADTKLSLREGQLLMTIAVHGATENTEASDGNNSIQDGERKVLPSAVREEILQKLREGSNAGDSDTEEITLYPTDYTGMAQQERNEDERSRKALPTNGSIYVRQVTRKKKIYFSA